MASQIRVVALFEESGNALRPWAEAGCECYAFDLENDGRVEHAPGGGSITYVKADLMPANWQEEWATNQALEYAISLGPSFVWGFPPCTDLAVSGARAFAAKAERDPLFQLKAVALFRTVETVGTMCGVPWVAENPASMVSTLWRRPDHKFNPWEYGGYLPEDDVHPRWPDYINPRDAYPKLTWLWSGGGFIMPEPKPVPVEEGYSKQFHKLGGKSKKTKQIRSETPRGFAQAVMEANLPPIWAKADGESDS